MTVSSAKAQKSQHAQAIVALVALAVIGNVATADTLVRTQAEYASAVQTLQPGDTILLANGEWKDFEIVFSGKGTRQKPITLSAEEKGRVLITGQSNLRLAGEHLVVSGLVFTRGHTPTNEVISFRRDKQHLAHHSRVTEVVIDYFNNPERFEIDFWVMMYGQHNRFDHNYLAGKNNAGVTMAVRLDSQDSQENHHRIDHNYFGHRSVLGSNGGETLRIGTSKYSLTDSHTTVENNYFDRCNGEVEIISSKSGRNVFRGNVFFESRGTLTLRHGNDNLIENNVFFGNRVDHTGGIRVINKRQTVRNNYLSGLTGYRFGGALVVMNGVPDSPINRYHQVDGALIENNTLINADHIELAGGSDEERSAPPVNSVFRSNLIVNSSAKDSIAVHDDITGIKFSGNVTQGVEKLPAQKGFERAEVKLSKAANGLEYPVEKRFAGVGVSRKFSVLNRDDTGPAWYPKPQSGDRFDSGRLHETSPGQDTLTAAIQNSAPGDIIQLQPGKYSVSKILIIEHPVTVRGSGGQRPHITFERSTLFELADGGSLKLDGVAIDGALAPDAYGNSVIRTSRYSMLSNYAVHISNSEVKNLNTNHSFNFLQVSKHTFAERIEINHTSMSDISGHVIALDREIDDLGIYNAEYVSIRDSSFKNIGGTVATVYRGGTDESTFGPHFLLEHCVLDNVGKSKRNKTKASVYLLGVQVATIHGNTIRNSRPVSVVQTVGDPITTIGKNTLEATEPFNVSSMEQ